MKSSITTQTKSAKSVLTAGFQPAFVVATILLLGAGSSVWAGNGNLGNPGVLPPHSHAFGKTYSQWTAAWEQWAFGAPAAVNPVSDLTGEFADVGQHGKVWFLAGTFGETAVRTCTVPVGKALFFPLLNQSWIQLPTDPLLTIEELRDMLAAASDNAILSCEIDGRSVRNLSGYRVQSVVYTTTLPEGNLLGVEAGDYAPCVDDGYYLMLAPLSRGQHTIHFTAESADHGFSLEVTYHLTVE